MKRTNNLASAIAVGFATLPLMIMSWVSYATAATVLG